MDQLLSVAYSCWVSKPPRGYCRILSISQCSCRPCSPFLPVFSAWCSCNSICWVEQTLYCRRRYCRRRFSRSVCFLAKNCFVIFVRSFRELILRKIIEIVATRCHIIRLKCTKFDFHWGSAPNPTGRAYSAPPDPLAVFKGVRLRGGRKKGRGNKEGRGRAPNILA